MALELKQEPATLLTITLKVPALVNWALGRIKVALVELAMFVVLKLHW